MIWPLNDPKTFKMVVRWSNKLKRMLTKVNKKWAGFVPAHFSLSQNPDFGEEIGVEVLIKDENRQKILKTAEKWGERGDIRPHSFLFCVGKRLWITTTAFKFDTILFDIVICENRDIGWVKLICELSKILIFIRIQLEKARTQREYSFSNLLYTIQCSFR